jgi:hypothetical protein
MPRGKRRYRTFAWKKLETEQPLYADEFSIFLVQVKSDSPAGRALHVDPIAFFEKNIPEMGLRKKKGDVRATVLRVNAEVSANPRHRSEVWITYPGSTHAVGVQYKYEKDMLDP